MSLVCFEVKVSATRQNAWFTEYVHGIFFRFHDMVISMAMLTCWITANIDLDECIARLYRKELLADSVIEAICLKAKELLMKESNVVHIAAPVTVVGDIHGQFFDMIEIFKIGGFCPDTNYLFLG